MAVLQSRKTLSKKRKPSPIPAGALTLPNSPEGVGFDSFNFFFQILTMQCQAGYSRPARPVG
ncbi:hypothetical protein AUH73_05870 [archaeon 13_1_40CM_4_53_4]|nr:MAG: hypothetical protein AUI07_04675 [archaeon 13_2_20CM_2_53_6]OLC61926.1 MAG: hypothetical protein AUH73_05870 [archaeon 13_1_40CM_4_53_4]OLE58527.1 MAG: hypothetical protein AUG17_06905 [Crenarchaeota archaeon 13_1_20CM_2_53_14]